MVGDSATGEHGAIHVYRRDGTLLETVEVPLGELFGSMSADLGSVAGTTGGSAGDARLIVFHRQ